jgi:transcriptional regulator with XRE-family HTH domain
MAFDRSGFERAVGTLLQHWRSKKGLTQEEIAGKIGIPRASYANLEAGRQRISVDVLWRASVVLGVSIATLCPDPVHTSSVQAITHQQSESLGLTTSHDITYFHAMPFSLSK